MTRSPRWFSQKVSRVRTYPPFSRSRTALTMAVAVIGGFLLSMFLVRLMQARTRGIAQAKGENPLF